MARYGMLINTTRCVGCFACRVACQMQNSLPPHDSYIRYEELESGTYPKVYAEQIPLQCQHCEDAPCVSVCPTGASYINDDGVVLVDRERCIGCKYCMTACPYNARIQDHETGEVEKCRFCVLSDDGSVPEPACVNTCVTKARIFGDLDDPKSEISQAIVSYNAKPIAPGLTRAKIYYVR
jgi:Fe-S-cluster-containing dehydrogenase component